MKLAIQPGQIGAAILQNLGDQEARHVLEVSMRADTVSLLIEDGQGGLVAYAVLGFDADEVVTIYAARAQSFIAQTAMRAIFGAAQVMGAPLRVHAGREKLRALASMFGASEFAACLDGDGIPMGVFDGV